jgi:type II secretory pathway component PulC
MRRQCVRPENRSRRVMWTAALVLTSVPALLLAADSRAEPNCLGQIFRAQPVYSPTGFRGFRVYPGENRQLFAKLGFVAGDLFETPGSNPEQAFAFFKHQLFVTGVDPVHMTVVRDKQETRLQIPGEVIRELNDFCPANPEAPPGN